MKDIKQEESNFSKAISGTQELLMELAHCYFLKTFNIISEMGLYPGQVGLIRHLTEQDGLSQRELASKLHIKPPTAAVSIKRLEKNGILIRKSDEKDQRISRIYLTPKGKNLGQKLSQMVLKNEQELFAGFSETEILLIRRFFAQMIENTKNTTPKHQKYHSFQDIREEKQNGPHHTK